MKRSILITGAASGIGRATAMLFAGKNWFVGLTDIDEPALKSLQKEIGKENSCIYKADVTSFEELKAAVNRFSSYTSGKMDLLFNCAGMLHMGCFDEIGIENQVKTVEVNLLGVMLGIEAALPLLKNTENSRVVSMNSACTLYGTPEIAAYSATKFGIKGLTEALNIEFERFGIHVCDVMVPYVDTPLLDKERKAASVEKLGIKITPNQVAQLIWKTTRKKKVHWTYKMKPFLFLTWLFPYARKPIVKLLTGM
ncbi:MAG: SDR family oxidoreductase [Proteobacteria bacterium]|nr:SDR family oxidoreductase [Pseudomonadota bacterium]